MLRRLGVPESGISVILIKSSSQDLRMGYSWKRNTGISRLFVIRTIDLSRSGAVARPSIILLAASRTRRLDIRR